MESNSQDMALVINLAQHIEDAYDRGDAAALTRLGDELRQQFWQLLRAATKLRETRFDPRLAQKLEIVYAALEWARNNTSASLRVDSVCDAIGTTEHSLRRACHRILGMGPKRYLLIRQLNMLRVALRETTTEPRNVTDLLTENGIFELGRASVGYRRLLGALPSETLRQANLTATPKRRAEPSYPGTNYLVPPLDVCPSADLHMPAPPKR